MHNNMWLRRIALSCVGLTICVLLISENRLKILKESENFPIDVFMRDLIIRDFTWPHPELCPNRGIILSLVIVILSQPTNAKERAVIRATWAREFRNKSVAIAFLVSDPPPDLLPTLQAENDAHRDIVLGRFADTFPNYAPKSLAAMHWARKYCQEAKIFLKINDEVFVNDGLLLRFLQHHSQRHSMWGHLAYDQHNLTQRSNLNQRSDVRGFLRGPSFMISGDCLDPLLDDSTAARFLALDDVFITGVLATKLGFHRHDVKKFSVDIRDLREECLPHSAITVHSVRYFEQFALWKRLHLFKNCSSLAGWVTQNLKGNIGH